MVDYLFFEYYISLPLLVQLDDKLSMHFLCSLLLSHFCIWPKPELINRKAKGTKFLKQLLPAVLVRNMKVYSFLNNTFTGIKSRTYFLGK